MHQNIQFYSLKKAWNRPRNAISFSLNAIKITLACNAGKSVSNTHVLILQEKNSGINAQKIGNERPWMEVCLEHGYGMGTRNPGPVVPLPLYTCISGRLKFENQPMGILIYLWAPCIQAPTVYCDTYKENWHPLGRAQA